VNSRAHGNTRTIDSAELSVQEARTRLLLRHGLPPDGGYSRRWWAIQFGGFKVSLPNFRWRRVAVPIHDVHHVVTGFACDPIGEMEMAAWEHAAGRFPSAWGTLFCLPLVALGAALAPQRIFAAFLLGRDSRTLYSALPGEIRLERPLSELQAGLLPSKPTSMKRKLDQLQESEVQIQNDHQRFVALL
jgi:hypothetical protein